MLMALILVVDDERDIRELIADTLKDEGYSTIIARNASQAVSMLAQEQPQAVLLDIWLEGSHLDGLGVLKTIKANHPDVPVIMISGHGNIKTAVDAIKLGAYDFIEKPFKIERLLLTLARALEASALNNENKQLRKANFKNIEIEGESKVIKSTLKQCSTIAPTNSRIIITGEPGTDREVFARFIHQHSTRSRKQFISTNVTNLDLYAVDKELFGTEKEDRVQKVGLLEKANGGTIFIDEITRLSLETQHKLLQALQTNSFKRMGGSVEVPMDIRFIVGAESSIKEQLENNSFSDSLYSRLNTASIELPPLRARQKDLEILCDLMIKHVAVDLETDLITLEPEAISILKSYQWPGNIAQLKNVVEWLIIVHGSNKTITQDMLPHNILSSIGKNIQSIDIKKVAIFNKNLKDARETFEREYIVTQLKRFEGNISKTAEYIGMDRTALHRKIRYLNILLDEAI